MQHKRSQGFTLIELLIVVVVLGIIVAVAYPAYQSTVQQSRQSDAKSALLDLSHQLERCYTERNQYDHDDCVPDFPVESDNGYYDVDATTLTATAFTLEATPAAGSPQQSDDDCTKFILKHTGEQDAEGADADHCW